ncbi:hypothetical protein Pint_18257 [Pistacia integerrima]|uniref:Uncharacterized protein n=1 Tax=Pistacia integerrima TaxID=434235 RepID=A0ACC0Z1H8_9ROSI|nr:hypothetical protein Pint_18257 [Pistacia integerrima]
MGSRTVNSGAQISNKGVNGMPSYGPPVPTSNQMGSEANTVHSQIPDFGTLEQSLGLRIEDAVDLSRSNVLYQMKSSSQAVGTDVQFGSVNKFLSLQKELQSNLVSVPSGHPENWGESNMAEASPRTDTSTDDTEDKNQRVTSLASIFENMLFSGNS